MNNFKLKIILSILGGIVFSFIFILLAFALPLDKQKAFKASPKNMLQKVSESAR